ncbi:MAG: hypothetical protein L6Q95_05575 [Planctomycetes bacterium]|nr:hypothetical protein [Planctomycetota bacterium]
MTATAPAPPPPRLEADPQLVEEVVHLLASADERRWAVYRRRIDPLYDRPDRDAAIPAALLQLFREWGAEGAVAAALGGLGVPRALLARSHRPGDEGADLLVGEERTVLLRLPAGAFLDGATLARYLRHEMRHVKDMLDPKFAYERDLGASGRTRAEQELVRNRYCVLWNLAIDRIEEPPVGAATRRAQLDRVFAALSDGQRTRLAARFEDPSLRTHPMLLAAARDPWEFLGEPRRGPVGGQPCPLCGFPTYDWDGAPPVAAIRADFPRWDASHGACRQCSDIYRAASAC